MESKSKISGTATESVMMDRFSDLPDQVAHHIISPLTISDLGRLGCVSKHCRELCLSSTSLVFDEFSTENESTCSNRQRLFNCLDRFLIRRGDNKIQSFYLRWMAHDVDDDEEEGNETSCLCDGEYFRMISWVHNAVRCNVEELDLDFGGAFEIAPKFPSSVFLCASLTTLSLDLNGITLTVPSFGFSSNLKFVDLKHCLAEEGFFQWISRYCKCIEDLTIEHVSVETITIESSSLKHFSFGDSNFVNMVNISGEKLEHILIYWVIESPSDKSLNICAPNLKLFYWKGNLMNHGNLGNLEFLEQAAIILDPKEDEFDSVFKVLCSLRRVKILVVSEDTMKVK